MSDSENISQSAFATVCRERDDAVALLAQYSAEREHNALQALAYKAERDDLDRWKAEQMAVESTWNEQAIGRLLNLPLGSPIRAQIQPAIESMREAIKEAHKALLRLQTCEGSPDIDVSGEARFGLHCGVEDRDCQDRYDGADFGYSQGVEKTLEWAVNEAKAALAAFPLESLKIP